MNFLFLGILLLTATVGHAQTYEMLVNDLKTATDKGATHRLKAQVATAAIQRLETEGLSKTAEKKLREEIRAHCADVQLGAMDLWYGASVVTWGRLQLFDGNWKEARSVLLDQAEVLQNIEKNLTANKVPVSSISPVAGCRYVLGETYRMEYEEFQSLEPAVQALKHLSNVYIKYGDSPWGEKARERADAAQLFVEGFGKQVRIDLGPHRETYVANKFKLGARLMAEERYADAIEPIETAINYFPENRKSVQAIRNLAICNQKLGRFDDAFMMAEYCCERFQSYTNASSAILSMGRQAIDAGEEAEGGRYFHLYLTNFPEDERRSDILSYFAWKAYKNESWMEAVDYFQSLEAVLRDTEQEGPELEKAVYIQAIHPADPAKLDSFITEFPASDLMASALNKKAQALLVAGDFDAAFQTLEILGERFPDAASAKTALAGLIVVAVESERFDIAEQVLHRMLEDKKAYGYEVYIATGEGLLSAHQYALSETAFSAVPLTAERKWIERAQVGIAACQFGAENFEASFQTLEKLLAKFPDTGRFYDARLMQARCLVQINRMEEAVVLYAEVVSAKQNYVVSFEMAQVLALPEEQLAAYQRIALLADPETPQNRPLIADSIVASLPLCLELHKYKLAISSCEQFETVFPEHELLPTIGNFRREAERALVQ